MLRPIALFLACLLLLIGGCRDCETDDVGYVHTYYYGVNTGQLRDGGIDRPEILPGSSQKHTRSSGTIYVEICVPGGECFGQDVPIEQCRTSDVYLNEPCMGNGYAYVNIQNTMSTDRWVIVDNDNALDALLTPGKGVQFQVGTGNHTIYSKVPGTWALLDSLTVTVEECGIRNWNLTR